MEKEERKGHQDWVLLALLALLGFSLFGASKGKGGGGVGVGGGSDGGIGISGGGNFPILPLPMPKQGWTFRPGPAQVALAPAFVPAPVPKLAPTYSLTPNLDAPMVPIPGWASWARGISSAPANTQKGALADIGGPVQDPLATRVADTGGVTLPFSTTYGSQPSPEELQALGVVDYGSQLLTLGDVASMMAGVPPNAGSSSAMIGPPVPADFKYAPVGATSSAPGNSLWDALSGALAKAAAGDTGPLLEGIGKAEVAVGAGLAGAAAGAGLVGAAVPAVGVAGGGLILDFLGAGAGGL